MWRAPVIDQNSPLSGCLEVVNASNPVCLICLLSNKRLVKTVKDGLIWFETRWSSLPKWSSGVQALSDQKGILVRSQIEGDENWAWI